jgi:hypothetical protein
MGKNKKPYKPELVLLPQIDEPNLSEFYNLIKDKSFLSQCGETTHILQFTMWNYLEKLFVINWVIKLRFNTKHRLPMQKEEKDFTKHLGDLYARVFVACERLHSFTSGEYRNAAHWWGLILEEKRIQGLNQGTKKDSWEAMKRENKKIRQYENPFESEKYPHTYKLIELLLCFSQQYGSDVLKKEVFSPLLKSRSDYIKNYHDNPECQVGIVKDGKEYRRMGGSGSGLRELSPLKKEIDF